MIDSALITVRAGNGGNGVVNFRREAFVPKGGPAGGDGGDGGSIVFVASASVNTLLKFRKGMVLSAGNGEAGKSAKKTGKDGDDLNVEVPVGTEVWDVTNPRANGKQGELIGDLANEGDTLVVAKGGKGGFGNTRFATSTNQTPMLAESGEPGEERELRLNLKLLADVGLIGMPNAGKSSILASISAAKPKIANYPFTTLEPSLGVVYFEHDAFVVVDIPGLIEGAHSGTGLGHEFLKHIERTRVLAHVVDASEPDIVGRLRTINEELEKFNERLASTPQMIVLNKSDLIDDAELQEWIEDEVHAAFGDDASVISISAATRDGMELLIAEMRRQLLQLPREPLEDGDERRGPVLRPKSIDNRPSVEVVEEDVFRIVHPRAIRLARASNLEDWTTLVQFQRRLSDLGVTKELEAAGVSAGATVIVDEMEFEWD